VVQRESHLAAARGIGLRQHTDGHCSQAGMVRNARSLESTVGLWAMNYDPAQHILGVEMNDEERVIGCRLIQHVTHGVVGFDDHN